MRRADDVFEREQRTLLGRLDLEDVERRTGYVACRDRVGKRCLVDQPATRTVNDAHAGLARRNGLGGENITCLVGERRVQRNKIGPPQQRIEFDLLNPDLDCALRRQKRVVGDNPHLQPQRPVSDDGTDVAAANDAKRLAAHFDTEKSILLPLARLRRGIRFGDLSRQRHHHCDRVLCRRDRIAERRIHHDDALRGRSLSVDVVDTDACAPDHLEACSGFEDLLGHLRRRADREAFVFADHLGQALLVLAQIRLERHVETAIPEDGNSSFRQSI
jgi:hypothetical protein